MFAKLDPSTTLPQRSSGSFKPPSPTRIGPQACSASTVAKRVRLLIGCYRKGEAEDPETYVTALAAVLSAYPEDVVVHVTDPLRGVPGRSKFLPQVAEVREACEEAMRPIREREARERRIRETQALLAAPERPPEAVRERQVEEALKGFERPAGPRQETPDELLARLAGAGPPHLAISADLARRLGAEP